MYPPSDGKDDECGKGGRIRTTFYQSVEIKTVYVDNSFQNAKDLGTVFIFNDNLFNLTTGGFMEVETWFATGTCTRTQNLETMGVGGGICNFVYTLTDSDNNFATFVANGEVFDGDGGNLSITGGARAFQSAVGEVSITPYEGQFNDEGELIGLLQIFTGDFWEADIYEVVVELETNDCSCGC